MSLRLIGPTLKPRKKPFETPVDRSYCSSPYVRAIEGHKDRRWRIGFTIDEEDYEKIKPFRWRIGERRYPMADMVFEYSNEEVVKIIRKPVYLHHFVLNLHLEPMPEKMCVDHIDGDTYHNWKANLRTISIGENTKHAKKLKELRSVEVFRPYIDELQNAPRKTACVA